MRVTAEKRIALVLVVIVLAIQAAVLIARSDREPHMDEVEMLHSGWLMANGAQIYKDFFQHHSPLVPALVAPLAPHAERVEAQPYAERARLVAGCAGLIALMMLALLVARIDPMAAPLALMLMFATGGLWLRVIADVRAETFAMLFFWIGTAFVTLPKKRIAALAGLGVGLVAFAEMWTPKWPLCAVVIGIWALLRAGRQWWLTVAVATAVVLAALALIHTIAPLDAVRFFTFELNGAREQWPDMAHLHFRPFHEGPRLLSLPFVGGAAVLLALLAIYERSVRPAWLFAALFAAAFVEVRFIHPYPLVGTHSYAMWGFAGSGVVALIPKAIVTMLLRANLSERLRLWIAKGIPIAAVLLLVPNVAVQASFARGDLAVYWNSQRTLIRRIHPGETVWMSSVRRNPITVKDAHYYWFGLEDSRLLRLVRSHREHGRGARYLPSLDELPICAALHGRSRVRFAAPPEAGIGLDSELPCFAALETAGRIRSTPFPHVYEILPAHP